MATLRKEEGRVVGRAGAKTGGGWMVSIRPADGGEGERCNLNRGIDVSDYGRVSSRVYRGGGEG